MFGHGGITIIQISTCLRSSIQKYNDKLSITVKSLRDVTLWMVKGPVTNYPCGGGGLENGKTHFPPEGKTSPIRA